MIKELLIKLGGDGMRWNWERFLLVFIACALYHLVVFILCVYLPKRFFYPDRRRYRIYQWENGGKWYQKNLKINSWKDRLPQYVAKGGFSKESLIGVSVEYLDAFLVETCRAEWYHTGCLILLPFLLTGSFWAPSLLFLAFALVVLHLPFLVIQRYNRARLTPLRNRIARRITGR